MIFSKSKPIDPLKFVNILNEEIDVVELLKLLGVTIDCCPNFS